jgi:hypothetical protein
MMVKNIHFDRTRPLIKATPVDRRIKRIITLRGFFIKKLVTMPKTKMLFIKKILFSLYFYRDYFATTYPLGSDGQYEAYEKKIQNIILHLNPYFYYMAGSKDCISLKKKS